MGSGRWGSGVYAVPLIMIQRFSTIYDEHLEKIGELTSDEISTSDLWKWLIKFEEYGNKNPALIQFESHPDYYPIDLYLRLYPDFSQKFLLQIIKENNSFYFISKDELNDANEASHERWCRHIAIKVQNVAGLGKVLNIYKSSGAFLWYAGDDSFEAVIRKPVPAKNIKKIIARYQTNKKFKARNRK